MTSSSNSAVLPGSGQHAKWVFLSGPLRQSGQRSSSSPSIRAMFRRVALIPIVCLEYHMQNIVDFPARASRRAVQSTMSNLVGLHPSPPLLTPWTIRDGARKNRLASAFTRRNRTSVATSLVSFSPWKIMTAAFSRGWRKERSGSRACSIAPIVPACSAKESQITLSCSIRLRDRQVRWSSWCARTCV